MRNTQVQLNILHLDKLCILERNLIFKFLLLLSFLLNVFNLNYFNIMPFGFLLFGCIFLLINLFLFFKISPPPLLSSKRTNCTNGHKEDYTFGDGLELKRILRSKLKLYFFATAGFVGILLLDANISEMTFREWAGVIFLSLSIGTMVFSMNKRTNCTKK